MEYGDQNPDRLGNNLQLGNDLFATGCCPIDLVSNQHTPFPHVSREVASICIVTKYELSREKINNVVSEQVQHKSGCTVTEAG